MTLVIFSAVMMLTSVLPAHAAPEALTYHGVLPEIPDRAQNVILAQAPNPANDEAGTQAEAGLAGNRSPEAQDDASDAKPARDDNGEASALQGMISYRTDNPRFIDCTTGRSFAILTDGDFAALEHAVLAAAQEPGGAILATFEGKANEDPKDRHVVVDRFIGVWPGETCENSISEISLTNTFWKITELKGTAFTLESDEINPHLVMSRDENRFSATIGCNQFAGEYRREDHAISFEQVTSTEVVCEAPLDELESVFQMVLEAAHQWEIDAEALILKSEEGAQLAKFMALRPE